MFFILIQVSWDDVLAYALSEDKTSRDILIKNAINASRFIGMDRYQAWVHLSSLGLLRSTFRNIMQMIHPISEYNCQSKQSEHSDISMLRSNSTILVIYSFLC